MKKKKVIPIDTFTPREYQLPFVEAFEKQTHRRFLLVWARRAGKDVCAFNLIFRAALRKVAVYYYILPEYGQARKTIWDSITCEGRRFLDYIPKEAVVRTNSSEMKITLVNGSIIQLIGSDRIDSIRGTNPAGAIFSEYAQQDEMAFQVLSPIFNNNGGWMVFISTPLGHNHFHSLYKIAQENPHRWYSSFLTVENTGHIDIKDIEDDINEGVISYDLARQEYWCDFEYGASGTYYLNHIVKARRECRITDVLYDPSLPVHTSWDLGINDPTVVIFFQVTIGGSIKIIDFYQKSGDSIAAHIKFVKEKPYVYGFHVGPHDVQNREQSTGITRWETAHALGFTFRVAPGIREKVYVQDGIEAVRTIFSRLYIDQVRCKDLVRHLENYRQEYDDKAQRYIPKPVRDHHGHSADALRYLATSLHLLEAGMTQKDIDMAKARARQGYGKVLPRAFR